MRDSELLASQSLFQKLLCLAGAYVPTPSVAADVTASLQTNRISDNTLVQKQEANRSRSPQTKEFFQKLRILQSAEAIGADESSRDKPAGCRSVCEGEEKLLFHRFSTAFFAP